MVVVLFVTGIKGAGRRLPESFDVSDGAPPTALLLGDDREPMNFNVGEEPILIGHELLSGFTVHVGLASGLIIEGIEDEIRAGLAFVLRRVPRDRAGLFTHQLGLPLEERFDFRFLTGFGLQLQEKRELGIHSIVIWYGVFVLGLVPHRFSFFGRHDETNRFFVIREIALSYRSDKL